MQTLNQNYQNNCSLIKQVRHRLRLSQGAFAKKLGITRAAISNYEAGHRSPALETAYKIIDLADKCGINISLEDIYPRDFVTDKSVPNQH